VIVNLVVPAFKVLWAIAKLAWTIISGVFKVGWALVHPILQQLWWIIVNIVIPVIKQLAKMFSWAWQNVIAPVLKFVWNSIISPILGAIKDILNTITGILQGLGGIAKTAFGALSSAISWVWNHSPIKLLVDAINTVSNFLGGGPSNQENLKTWTQRGPSRTAAAAKVSGAAQVGSRGGAALNRLPGMQYGGLQAVSGWKWVGEQGPELVRLPGGSRVFSNAQSRQGLTDTRFNLHLEVPVIVSDREIARAVAKYRDDRAARR
jgi:hypothetical protein